MYNFVADPENDESRTFTETFSVDNPTSADLDIAADNSYDVYVNNTLVTGSSDEDNYHLANQDTVSLLPYVVTGNNTLKIVVKNWAQTGGSAFTNPAGVLFKLVVKGDKDENCKVTTKPTDPEPTTGSIEIKKYICPADTEIKRSTNGVGSVPPQSCSEEEGATFSYVHGTQTDANGPSPELEDGATVVAGGATDESGDLTISNLANDGRYLVYETDGEGNKLPAGDILGLFCEGDGDTNDTNNDNQELTFVPADGVAHCVAYNKMPADPIDPEPQTYTLNGFKWNDLNGNGLKDGEEGNLSGWTITATNGEDSTTTVTGEDGYYSFSLPAGNWTVSETPQNNWTETGLVQNSDSILDSETTSCHFLIGQQSVKFSIETADVATQSFNCDFGNHYTAPTTPTDDSTTTSPVSRSSHHHSGSSGTQLPPPQVLGASTTAPVCGIYLTDYMRKGNAASSTQVTKLQIFLNAVGITLGVTGVFDEATDAAVRTFQAQHKTEVLTPWFTAGIVPHDHPTGWVYQLTRWKINNIVCPGSEAYPQLQK